ncbi:tissue inhibitor of metalloproteinase [Anopheles darlingi]|uniref:tissue inhibitor of metalloproteinase n=1 Tax=Anopheles darlingi TaxID=43151 RepID=UPI0021001783|nr:tissue inhibitor of metalloproteinase [Anopheles darlingi]XP_049532368.1 tissue inhibitor of metalloproteinase [Anopheles darlingi]XP_049532369.1 tissue inhibitor of metalloproteinase [Anopheles darlingi]
MRTNSLPLMATGAVSMMMMIVIMTVPSEACSCMPQHPQSAYCEADYVIVAQVLRKSQSTGTHDAYKIAIKKEYKMSDAAREELRHGKLYTPSVDSACGRPLEPNKLYAIAANTNQIGLCNYVQPYAELSLVEKRGLAGMYRKGCDCRVVPCFGPKCVFKPGACSWSPFTKKGDCETMFGSCVPAGRAQQNGVPTKCHWRRSPRFSECLANGK